MISIPANSGISSANSSWGALTSGAYCWYNNDVSYKSPYGALYNWFAVSTEKLSPKGWHIPTNNEWTILSTYLGGESVAGGKLKEAGTTYWLSPNTGASNEKGFTALPGGSRDFYQFGAINQFAIWWSSTASDSNNAYYKFLFYNDAEFHPGPFNGGIKQIGYSVRCLKD